MAKHSNGISLRNRATGPHRYRDEVRWDGDKRYLRRRVRAMIKKIDRKAEED